MRLLRQSSFKVSSGNRKAGSHAKWESKIAPRVRLKIVEPLLHIDKDLILPEPFGNKIGDVKHFHSLAPAAQEKGLAIAELRGHVNAGHNPQVKAANDQFTQLAREILKRSGA